MKARTTRNQHKRSLQDKIVLTAVLVTVSGIGVALGSFIIAPELSGVTANSVQSLVSGIFASVSLNATAAINFTGELIQTAFAGLTGRAIPFGNASLAAIAATVVALAAVAVVLAIRGFRARKTGRIATIATAGSSTLSARTPREVHALAASGKPAVEIAARTRLSVDAVAMLLSLRQPA
jgi:hypothetical protein